jgi:hypothetical protein
MLEGCLEYSRKISDTKFFDLKKWFSISINKWTLTELIWKVQFNIQSQFTVQHHTPKIKMK